MNNKTTIVCFLDLEEDKFDECLKEIENLPEVINVSNLYLYQNHYHVNVEHTDNEKCEISDRLMNVTHKRRIHLSSGC